MSKTETKAQGRGHAPDGQSPAAEVKTALAGFMSDIKSFHDDIETKLAKQEERLTMLDRKSRTHSRPALAAADFDAPHHKAFAAYLRSGDDDGLRGLVLEGKAMSTAVASDGGYLVDPETAATIASVLDSTASIRQIANVVHVEGSAYDVLIDRNDLGSGWADETTATTETGTPTIERISVPLHELAALPKISQRLLDDSAFDIETWLAGRVADKFARAEAASFISGDGAGKPTGILDHPAVDNTAWNWGSLGYVATGVSGGFELEDRRELAQDEGCRRPLPVVGRDGSG
jgi:HK97 family phage major capsid protein